MASFRSTSVICALLLQFISGSLAAPEGISLESSADGGSEDSGTAAAAPGPAFKCSPNDLKLNDFCGEKSTIWKGTPKHDCCWQYLKNDCIKDTLETVCEDAQYRIYFKKLTQDNEFMFQNEECLKNADKSYCRPTLSELRGESPISNWMVTVAGIGCFLLILCAIALGIKFC